MKKHQTKAFTLVELIIVITILAILATIGFMSYQSYTIDARDGKRVADLGQIRKGLEIYQTKNAKLPIPDEQITNIVNGGNLLGYQGYAGTNVLTKIRADRVKDPKDNISYTYSTNGDYTKFQLLSMLENGNVVNISQTPLNTTYAENNYTDRKNYVVGNKLGLFLYNSTNVPIQETLSGNIDLGGAYSGTSFKVVFANTSANSGTIVGSGVSLYNNVVSIANTITQTQVSSPVSKLNVVDFFGDNSGKALYRFEDNTNSENLTYNQTSSSMVYSTGKFGKCADFSTSRPSASIPNNILSGLTSFTFSARINMNNVTTDSSPIGTNAASPQYYLTPIRVENGKVFSSFGLAGTSGIYTPQLGITTGSRNFIVFVFNSDKTIQISLNGANLTTKTSASSYNLSQIVNNINLFNSSIDQTTGKIDHIRFFNRVLNQSEITELYNEQ